MAANLRLLGAVRPSACSRLASVARAMCSSAPSTSGAALRGDAERDDGHSVLRTLIQRYKAAHGTEFVVPDAAQRRVSAALQHMLHYKVDGEWLVDAFVAEPKLTHMLMHKTKPLAERMHLFRTVAGCSLGEILKIMLACADKAGGIFDVPVSRIQDMLNALGQLGMTSRQTRHMLRKCPRLPVDTDAVHIWHTANSLTFFFTSAQATHLLQTAPQQVLYTPFDDLESRYEHLHFNMGGTQAEIHKCAVVRRGGGGGGWLNMGLGEIKLRHEFVRRTGAWSMPDPRRPHLPLANPDLSAVLSADESRLARAANVTQLEWRLFKQMHEGTKRFADYSADVPKQPLYDRRWQKGNRRGDDEQPDQSEEEDDFELD